MTTTPVQQTRTELASLLTEAAQSVSSILTTDYPTTAPRSYLQPVLGPLSAGPQVVTDLIGRLEAVLADGPPTTQAGFFTLASYASALGWLTESLTDLTNAVARICARIGTPADLPRPTTAAGPDAEPEEESDSFFVPFTESEFAVVRTAAEAAGLSTDDYVYAVSMSLLAATRITDDCMEISNGLLDDASYILDKAPDDDWAGEGPTSLPTLVRSLIARMETDA